MACGCIHYSSFCNIHRINDFTTCVLGRKNNFTIFVSIAVAIIGAGWKAYDTEIQRNTVIVICFAVTVILGLISWKGIKARESE